MFFQPSGQLHDCRVIELKVNVMSCHIMSHMSHDIMSHHVTSDSIVFSHNQMRLWLALSTLNTATVPDSPRAFVSLNSHAGFYLDMEWYWDICSTSWPWPYVTSPDQQFYYMSIDCQDLKEVVSSRCYGNYIYHCTSAIQGVMALSKFWTKKVNNFFNLIYFENLLCSQWRTCWKL